MKVLSLKLKENIFTEAEEVVKQFHISRNAYINQALQFYNQLNRRKLLRKKLQEESKFAISTSLEVLREMEKLEDHLGE